MYAAGRCCDSCDDSSRSGLGFPIVPIIMGVVSVVGAVKAKKKSSKISDADAKSAVQQVYLELLERDPWNPNDPGAMGYVNCLLEGWCDVDFIRTEVLKSKEYKDVQMRKAAVVYNPAVAPSGFGESLFLGGTAPGGGIVETLTSGTVAGIPFTWIALGLGLVLLMKRR